jgi:hypothetical protein
MCGWWLATAIAAGPGESPAGSGEPPGAPSPGATPVPAEPGTPPEGGVPAGMGPSVGGSGVVVRLLAESTLGDAPTVRLVPQGGKTVDVVLHDDGKDPDVAAGDGMWSGAGFSEGDQFAVSLVLGGTPTAAIDVSWASTDTQRDLSLKYSGGVLSGQADVSRPAPAGGTPTPPEGAPTPPEVAPATPPGGEDGAQPPPSPGAPPGAGVASSGDATWYLVFGGGLLAAAVLGYFWFRGRGDDAEGALPPGVRRVPEPGLFGEGTPPASGGTSAWALPAERSGEAFAGLLASVAAGRRVLVVTADDTAVPSVPGGPVHRIRPDDVEAVLDAADELLGNDSGGVVVWDAPLPGGSGRAALLAELPRGAGLLVLGEAGDPAWPTAALRYEGGWFVEAGEVRRALRLGGGGFAAG